jgi:hypothetical protein
MRLPLALKHPESWRTKPSPTWCTFKFLNGASFCSWKGLQEWTHAQYMSEGTKDNKSQNWTEHYVYGKAQGWVHYRKSGLTISTAQPILVMPLSDWPRASPPDIKSLADFCSCKGRELICCLGHGALWKWGGS